jgi:hypothetical protein
MKKLALHFLVTIFAIQSVVLCAQEPEKPALGFTLTIFEYHSGVFLSDVHALRVRLTSTSNEERREGMCPENHGGYRLLVLYNGVSMEERPVVQELRKKGAYERCFGDLQLWRTKPGEYSDYFLYANNFYDMSKPGTYTITVTKDTFPDNPEKNVTVKSNTIEIVVPEPTATAPK